MAYPFPLIAWGSPEPLNASPWSAIGSVTIASAGSTGDPFYGSGAWLLTDTDAANVAGVSKEFAYSGDAYGRGFLLACIKKSSGLPGISLYDGTSPGHVSGIYASAWGSGAPTLAAFGSSPPTLIPPVALYDGWYAILIPYNGVSSAHDNHFCLYPDYDNGGVDGTGATYFFVQNMVILDSLEGAVAWPDPRPGSTMKRSAAGVSTSWIKGWDHKLRTRIPSIPPFPRGEPVPVSGWEGLNLSIGVDCGVEAMLQASRDSKVLKFARDRANSWAYNNANLLLPFEGGVEIDDASDRTLDLTLVSTSPFRGY